jgi:hypothetical protein
MNKILRLSLIIGLAVVVILSALIPGMTVSAEDNAGGTAIGDVTDPGILPDSGFYFMKSWGRNLQLMFAGSDTEKARLMLKYTNEDALALQKMYQMGKYDVGTRHAEQYALQLQNTVQNMEQLRTRQGNSASEELVGKLEQNYLRQQEVLLSILEKAPEAAQGGLLNAIENSNKHVAAIVMAQNGEQALQQYQEQVNQQTKNMGQETKLIVQQKLEVMHGQATQSSGSNSSGQGVMNQIQTQTQNQVQTQTQNQAQTQSQTSTQTMQQTGQQSGQQNTQNQGAGQSNTNSGSGTQGSGNQKQGK